jgi:hypothetical protein
MVTDDSVRGRAFVIRLPVFFAILSVLFFIPGVLFALDQTIFWPMQEESVQAPRETIFWRTLVLDFKQRLAKSSGDKDIKISFLNTPYGKHIVEDLMAYTLSGDGTVTVQMHDTMKKIAISPEELYWMGQFLLEHHLEDLPELDPDDPESAEFRISLRVDGRKKTLRLYNSHNNKDREIIWQYLYSFGLRLLQTAGLSDQNKVIMPVCQGVTGIQEIDTDSDGLIDWLKLRLEFYAFKSGDFTVGFCGRKTNIFLAQGNTVHYVYINTYLIKSADISLHDYSKITIDTKPPNPKGPYILDLKIDPAGYAARSDLRATPDFFSEGADPVSFEARLNQEVILEMTRSGQAKDRAVIRFTIKEVQPDRVVIGNDTESIVVTARDPFFLHDIECMGCILSFIKSDGGTAMLEVGWVIPDKAVIENKIRYFNEAFASDNYSGDKEQVRASLETALSCKEAIESAHDLQVGIIYTSPAE